MNEMLDSAEALEPVSQGGLLGAIVFIGALLLVRYLVRVYKKSKAEGKKFSLKESIKALFDDVD